MLFILHYEDWNLENHLNHQMARSLANQKVDYLVNQLKIYLLGVFYSRCCKFQRGCDCRLVSWLVCMWGFASCLFVWCYSAGSLDGTNLLFNETRDGTFDVSEFWPLLVCDSLGPSDVKVECYSWMLQLIGQNMGFLWKERERKTRPNMGFLMEGEIRP